MGGTRIIQFVSKEIKKILRPVLRSKSTRSSWVFVTTENENFHAVCSHPFLEAVTSTQRNQIRSKVNRQRRMQQLQWAVAVIISIYLLRFFILGTLSYVWQSTIGHKPSAPQHLTQQKIDMQRYLFYVNDGNEWLEQEHYHNAIFQYKKALELFPSSDAQFRLARAYSYHCQYHDWDCEVGLALVHELQQKFPLSSELDNLELVFQQAHHNSLIKREKRSSNRYVIPVEH